MNEIKPKESIAYFSMEIGLESKMPTYSGGLGMLAGDTIRSAADMGIPLVAVTLLHRKGYFTQHLDAAGWQQEEPVEWRPEEFLVELPERVDVIVEERSVQLRSWRYLVNGVGGSKVPVIFLDANLPGNSDYDKSLTDYLYGGDGRYRLCQEAILGIGGARMLNALGFKELQRYHMNEGHASLLTLELLNDRATKASRKAITHDDLDPVRRMCVFTTHTPVPAGHDQFPMGLVAQVLGRREIYDMKEVFCCEGGLNMTFLAANLSHYINGVAKRHGEISRHMISRYVIDAITNGVHAGTWTSQPFRELFDRYISDWHQDNFSLRSALGIPRVDIWEVHTRCKERLIEHVNRKCAAQMDAGVLTLGFARRAATYKRGDLLFSDLERLKRISSRTGKIQVIYAGKAHPADQGGKEIIRHVFQIAKALHKEIKVT